MTKSLYNINGEVTAEQYDQVCYNMTKQQLMKPKYKLPTFDCPCCGAKKILFADDTVSKNETILEIFRENGISHTTPLHIIILEAIDIGCTTENSEKAL